MDQRTRRALLLTTSACNTVAFAQPMSFTYPETRRAEVDDYFGTKVADPMPLDGRIEFG